MLCIPARAATAQQTTLHVLVMQGLPSSASRDLIDGFRRRLEQLGRRADMRVLEMNDEGTVGGGPGGGGGGGGGVTVDLVLALGSRATALAVSRHPGAPIIGALLARESALPEGGSAAAVVLEFPLDVELDWMHRILPNAHRVGVLYSTDENAALVARARDVGRGLGIEIVARRVVGPSEIPTALAALAGSADALWGISDNVVLTPETAKAVLLASLRGRIPFVGLSFPWVRAGAVYALDRDYSDLGAQTADLAIRLVAGTPVRAIGIVRPRQVRYSLNARSAELMGVALSADLTRGATEIVR